MTDEWITVKMHVTVQVKASEWPVVDDKAADIYSYLANHITYAPSLEPLLLDGDAIVVVE